MVHLLTSKIMCSENVQTECKSDTINNDAEVYVKKTAKIGKQNKMVKKYCKLELSYSEVVLSLSVSLFIGGSIVILSPSKYPALSVHK